MVKRRCLVWVCVAAWACAAPAAPAAKRAQDTRRPEHTSELAPAHGNTASDGEADAGLAEHARVEPWPQASARFHDSGAWLGADSAYSIDLDATHVLWLFADTFIDPKADGSRDNGPNVLIRNSVGIQSAADAASAHDLSRCSLQFFWHHDPGGAPTSFFGDTDSSQEWVWPLHGARLPDGVLLLFRMHVLKDDAGFGFRVDGWDALAVDDPSAPPDRWRPRALTHKVRTFDKLVGSSVLIHDGFVYAYAVDQQGQDHPIYLARWALAALAALDPGALDDPEWWNGRGFVRQSKLAQDQEPSPVFGNGQVELSVHYDAARQRFVEVQTQGLFLSDPQTQIALRTAPLPQGPWSALTAFFRPPESALSNASDLAAYAAKAHPEQRGAELVLTYVVNDLKHFPPGDRLYYPQVLRMSFAPVQPP